jgi:hypothetical protein
MFKSAIQSRLKKKPSSLIASHQHMQSSSPQNVTSIIQQNKRPLELSLPPVETRKFKYQKHQNDE